MTSGPRTDQIHLLPLAHSRREYSVEKMGVLASQLDDLNHPESNKNLSIYITGSFARGEASKYSDVDLFFIRDSHDREQDHHNIDEICLFSDIIKIADGMSFPRFSNDGQYLQVQDVDEILKYLGSPDDDYKNHFTARMLLILESRPLWNESVYKTVRQKVVESYFRDFLDHSQDFKPTFLVNDIMRFWKTLCLNYEHRRNRNEMSQDDKVKQKIRNFKLKFSRLLTCYATIIALTEGSQSSSLNSVISLVDIPPSERLLRVGSKNAEYGELVGQIFQKYQWFLEKTELSEHDLQEHFRDKERTIEAFRKADSFGQSMFDLLQLSAKENDYLRYLVV